MNITLNKPRPHGEVEAIPSKSYAHRALICAALSDGETKIKCSRTSRDIDATVSCLNSLGAHISYKNGYFTVNPIKKTPLNADLYCGESGSTLRFLLPIVSAFGVNAEFHTEGRLLSRPLSPLSDELISHGAEITLPPLRIKGKIKGGKYSLDGSVSSQFTTGLMLALPLIEKNENSCIELKGKVESKPYIDLTAAVLSEFGVAAENYNHVYYIKGKYLSPENITVEGDWSNAAFMLCAGAFSTEGVTVRGLNIYSTQGDKKIFDIIKKFGAECYIEKDCVTVKKDVIHGITIDASDIPDLVPIISVVASKAEGITIIENCGRLRLKESDRIESTCAMVSSLGGDIRVDGDSIIIKGKTNLTNGNAHAVIDAYNDHRIAMAAAVGAAIFDGKVTIKDYEAVSKSYPDFFEDFIAICR